MLAPVMRKMLFFFDFMSPYAYLAAQRLPGLAERFGRDIEYCPIDLPKAKLAAGNTGPANREIPAKHRYLRTDLQRWAGLYGVPLVPPRSYGSDRVNRGTFFAIDRGMVRRYVLNAWHLIWGCGGRMDAPELLWEVCAELGWERAAFDAYVDSPQAAQRYEASQKKAEELGVFGVPMVYMDGQMWWGNDRLQFVEAHLSSVHPPAQPARAVQ
jgi:2-hydroxychromene-2-carboxylate isomerase